MTATEYLNVDLDVIASYDLQPLATAFGKKVSILYVGPYRRRYLASLEVSGVTRSAEKTVARFVSLVRALNPAARRLWKEATTRELDIGIQAGAEVGPFRLTIGRAALRAAADIDARLVVTVYGSGVSRLRKRRRARPPRRRPGDHGPRHAIEL
jgi:hypothetical protein